VARLSFFVRCKRSTPSLSFQDKCLYVSLLLHTRLGVFHVKVYHHVLGDRAQISNKEFILLLVTCRIVVETNNKHFSFKLTMLYSLEINQKLTQFYFFNKVGVHPLGNELTAPKYLTDIKQSRPGEVFIFFIIVNDSLLKQSICSTCVLHNT
jgi:hypothetical protein